MKKIAILILFALLSTAGFSQLGLTAQYKDNQMQVAFPSGLLIEYRVNLVDPINPGKVELKKGIFDVSPTANKTLSWEADMRNVYELTYRVEYASGELSEWFTVDPKTLIPVAEGR